MFSSSKHPECDLLHSEVLDAAQQVLKHIAGNDSGRRALLIQQFNLFIAAYPLVNATTGVAGMLSNPIL